MDNPFYTYYHRGLKQNSTHYHTYCKACVRKHLLSIGASVSDLTQGNQTFVDACTFVGSTRSDKLAWIAHLIGGQGKVACVHALEEGRAYATTQREGIQQAKTKKRSHVDSIQAAGSSDIMPPPAKKQQIQSTLTTLVFRRNDMPFSKAEAAALQKQALRAIVSSGAPSQLFEDPEMLVLFGMLRTTAPEIIPSGKVVGGRLLNSAAAEVESKIAKVMEKQNVGLATDGWKSNKDSVNALCANIEFQSILLELMDVTALNKDGQSMCDQFTGMIDRVEEKYGCVVIYFTTDADGGSKKGRILLGKQRPWLILPSCWAHQFQLILGDYFKENDIAAIIAEDATALICWLNNHGKVRKIFDTSQATISEDRNAGKVVVLAYLVANLTRWTTHFVAFARLFAVRQALQLAVMQKKTAIIAAEVGAATSTEAERLTTDATRFCALIEDASFWSGLETVLGDLEPICLGTNINQKDSTRLDQVLLTIAGIFLRFADHPEPHVKDKMLIRLEKRWKDCDQPAFLLALILNPFEKLSCFGPNANMNHFKCRNLLLLTYRRMKSRPDNEDTQEQRTAKEAEVSKAFMQYLSGTGEFLDFKAEEEINTDPIAGWEAFAGSGHRSELVQFAILILHIVANQAGCERTFSRTKIEQAGHRNRLKLQNTDKRTKVKAQIRSEHQKQGLTKPREGRKNHKSIETLLSVPRYRDLLEDQDDEDTSERGRALVSTPEGWRTQLAKWIGDAKAAERAENSADTDDDETDDDDLTSRIPNRLPGWKAMTLQVLFGDAEKPRARKPSKQVMEEEEELMQALADAEEDEIPDDGAIEIDSGDEFVG
ncbi:ribonuclease H-like domain-containing protein [Mycena sp. CBHHK59/15]|nr:ribonuclease H-like domain-containing protein [Mycena sp. CBHHK59/15]